MVAHRPPLDEAGDQDSLRLDEGDHLGAHACDRGETAGLALDPAIDAQQAAAFRRDPDDEHLAVDRDPIVAVRDAAGQRLGNPWPATPAGDPIQDRSTHKLDVHRSIAYLLPRRC